MSECTKCGRGTNNPAIQDGAVRSKGIIEDDFNGVVWLCDEHAEEFREWLNHD